MKMHLKIYISTLTLAMHFENDLRQRGKEKGTPFCSFLLHFDIKTPWQIKMQQILGYFKIHLEQQTKTWNFVF